MAHSLALTVQHTTASDGVEEHNFEIYPVRDIPADAELVACCNIDTAEAATRVRANFAPLADATAIPLASLCSVGCWRHRFSKHAPSDSGTHMLAKMNMLLRQYRDYACAGYDMREHITNLEQVIAAYDATHSMSDNVARAARASIAAALQETHNAVYHEAYRFMRERLPQLFIGIARQEKTYAERELTSALRGRGIARECARGWLIEYYL